MEIINELNINRITPYKESFNNNPASSNDIEILASQWTSGNQ